MRSGMQAIRDAVGADVFLLGCGMPLGSGLGLVDANRIGPDVSGRWTPEFAGLTSFFMNEPGMPSARNSIRNGITRAALQGKWWANDPDCLLLRDDTHLTLQEVRSLASVVALTGGSLLISDDLGKVKPERLRIAEVLIPIMGLQAQVLDWFDHELPEKLRLDLLNDTGEWHIGSAFNWSSSSTRFVISPSTFGLTEGEYWMLEFWSGKLHKVSSSKAARFENLLPHEGLVFGIRKAVPNRALYLGSDLHISQGLEVSEWQETSSGVDFKLRLPRTAEGNIVVSIPQPAAQVLINGEPIEPKQINEEVLQLPVKVEGFAAIEIKYGGIT
jgi:alpha-galactosidase